MFTVEKLVKSTRPRVPFEKIKNSVLGRRYSLSLVLCGNTLTHKFNKQYRKKDKPTNVLSFPLEENEGEIFLNLPLIKKEAQELDQTVSARTGYLFIHGLLHLKGYQHGSTMEKEEEALLRRFGLRL
ncbi:rRNA maturation RNase YbeY [bacterium]|nr:rRNA maturation RNase YbeY [bacterium]|tara:strand:+ start:28041 stop:28421 length:381 start_codon:yes stop_codon:yes gene_type:complete